MEKYSGPARNGLSTVRCRYSKTYGIERLILLSSVRFQRASASRYCVAIGDSSVFPQALSSKAILQIDHVQIEAKPMIPISESFHEQ